MRYPYLWFAVLFIGATVHIAEDFTPAQKNFWSFRPVQYPTVPSVEDKTWIRTPN